MNVTISNSTAKFNNETDLTDAIHNENITMTTEKSVISFENTTFANNESNSTQFDTVATTTSISEYSTTELFESSTTESEETTTQSTAAIQPAIAIQKSNSCVDSEFECCPNGVTPARVIDFLF
jgi:hypothetical protein